MILHTDRIKSYLVSQGCRHHDAEEIAQEVAVSLITSPPESLSWSYVRNRARWVWIDKIKRSRLVTDIDEVIGALTSPVPQPADPRMDVLLSCLSQMSDDDQQAIRLHYWDGLSRVEASEFLGLTKNGWKNRLQRAKSRLKELCDVV